MKKKTKTLRHLKYAIIIIIIIIIIINNRYRACAVFISYKTC